MIARSVADRLSRLGLTAAGVALVALLVSPLIAAVPPRSGPGGSRASLKPGASVAPGAVGAAKDPVVAKVEGKPIRLGEVEMLRDKNLERYKQQMGRTAPKEYASIFLRAGLEEAIRRRLLELDATSRGMTVSDAQAESLMRSDPFFQIKGAFDARRFAAYKTANPTGFGLARDEARAILLSQERLSQLTREFSPTSPEVDARARYKTTQANLRYTLVSDLHYDPDLDPTDDEMRAYYAREKETFAVPAELHYSTALVLGADRTVTARAADSLLARVRAGAPFDSAMRAPGIVPGSAVWRSGVTTGALGTRPALAESLLTVTPPYVLPYLLDSPDGALLLRVDAARARTVPPLSRVAIDLRARWRAEKSEAADKVAIGQYYAAHPDSFAVPAWQVRWGIVDSTRIRTPSPSDGELKTWFAKHETEFARLDPNGGGIQMRPLADVRPLAIARWRDEERARRTRQLADDAATAWAHGGSGPSDAALTAGGPAWIVEDGTLPSGLTAALADSARSWTTAPHGLVVADPVGYALVALVRHDTRSHVPLESVEPRVRELVLGERAEKDAVKARAWYDAHQDHFRTGPGYVVTCVQCPFPEPQQVDVPAADIERYYKDHVDEFSTPAEVRVRHVLIGLDRHTESEAHSIAAQILSRARRGEDFEQLARNFSEDPGSRDKGGDLGFIRKGQTVPQFEAAAFALTKEKPLSPVVRSQFGFHVLQLVERHDGTVKPFDDVQPDIGRRLATAYADTVARQQAERLRIEAKTVDGLLKLATERNLASQLGNWWDGLPLVGVALIDDVRRDVALVKPGELLPGVYRNQAQGFYVVGLDSTLKPQQLSFEAAESRALEESRHEARAQIASRRADRLAHDLSAGVPWDEAIETVGGEVTSGPIPPGQGLPTLGTVAGLDSLVFGPGADTLRTGGWARLAHPRGDLFIHLDQRIPGTAEETRNVRVEVASALLNRRIYDYVETLRKQYAVSVLRSDLSVRIPPPPLD